MHAGLLSLLLALSPGDFERHVADLSHRSHRVRDAAEKALRELGHRGAPRLQEAAKHAKDLDARKRLERLAAELVALRREWAVRTVETRYGECLPMIDAVWLDTDSRHYNVEHWSYRHLRPYLDACAATDTDQRRWAWWRVATGLWYTDLLESGVPVVAVDALYLWMRARDNIWIVHATKQIPDPWHLPGWTRPPACPHWQPDAGMSDDPMDFLPPPPRMP